MYTTFIQMFKGIILSVFGPDVDESSGTGPSLCQAYLLRNYALFVTFLWVRIYQSIYIYIYCNS
jgi:hypothetical protein